jgi:putative transposase
VDDRIEEGREDPEAGREGEAQLALRLSERTRKHRRGRMRRSWYVDEAFSNVQGRWTHLYRAVEREGNLVDVPLREERDKATAEACFRSARTVTGSLPARVTQKVMFMIWAETFTTSLGYS